MSTDKDVKISYVDVQEDSSSKSTDYSISKSNIPSYSKILVPDDGKEIQIKHLIMQSPCQISRAEIVILRIIENIDKLGDTSVSVSQSKEPDTKSGFKHNVEGELVIAMEEKIKKFPNGRENKKMCRSRC
jgi:hypothetical protein